MTVEILGKKENKFWRDKMTFQEGKAYKWLQNNHVSGNRTKGLTKSTAERGSSSFINSCIISSSQNCTRNRQKKPKRPLSGDNSNVQKKLITDTASSSISSASGMLGNYAKDDSQGDTSIWSSGPSGAGLFTSQHMGVQLTQDSYRTVTSRVREGGFFPQGPVLTPDAYKYLSKEQL